LRNELKEMKARTFVKKALDLGLSKEEMEGAVNKEGIIDLIIAKKRAEPV